MSQRTTRKNSAPATHSSFDSQESSSNDVTNKDILECVLSLRKEIQELRTCIHSLDSRMVNIENSLSALRDAQNNTDSEMKNMKIVIDELKISQKTSATSILREVEEREERKDNIMVFGLTEMTSGSVEDRRQHDKDLLYDVLEDIGLSGVETVSFRRVGGSQSEKARPLKVQLEDRTVKASILKKARDLRDSSEHKHVYISNDLTKLQQKERLQLRKDLKVRREAGEDVVIYNNEIRERKSLKKNF